MAGSEKENQQLQLLHFNKERQFSRRKRKVMQQRQDNCFNQAKIKDLCPDDKARIRQLVEDLARLGTEKEQIECDWKKERNDLEGKLSVLRKRQTLLLKEKTALEENLKDTKKSLKTMKKNIKGSSTPPPAPPEPKSTAAPVSNDGNNVSYSTAPGYAAHCQSSYAQQWTLPQNTVPTAETASIATNTHPHSSINHCPHMIHHPLHHNNGPQLPPQLAAPSLTAIPSLSSNISATPFIHHFNHPVHPATDVVHLESSLDSYYCLPRPSYNPPLPPVPPPLPKHIPQATSPPVVVASSKERSHSSTPTRLLSLPHPQASSTSFLNSNTWCTLQETDTPVNTSCDLSDQSDCTLRKDVSIQTCNESVTKSKSGMTLNEREDEEDVLSILLNSQSLTTSLILMSDRGRGGGEREETKTSSHSTSLLTSSLTLKHNSDQLLGESNEESDSELIEDLFFM